jgi:hypothetical protein
MEQEFVPYEWALRLKALGFKGRTLTYYENGKPKLHNAIEGWDFNSSFLTCVSRPTLSQAFKWFRDKYEYISCIKGRKSMGFDFTLSDVPSDVIKRDTVQSNFVYDTYEEAEMDCLIKVIEIVEKVEINN